MNNVVIVLFIFALIQSFIATVFLFRHFKKPKKALPKKDTPMIYDAQRDVFIKPEPPAEENKP